MIMTISTFLNTTLCTFFTKTYHEHFSSCCKFIKEEQLEKKIFVESILTLQPDLLLFALFIRTFASSEKKEASWPRPLGFSMKCFLRRLSHNRWRSRWCPDAKKLRNICLACDNWSEVFWPYLITGDKETIGVLGDQLGHNVSPQMTIKIISTW